MAVKSEADFEILLNVAGEFHYFTEMSGGEQTHETEAYPLGNKYGKGYIKGMPVVSEITLRRPYDPTQDDPLGKLLQAYCDEQVLIQVTPMKTCPEYVADGESTVYTELSPTKIGRPQPNRGNSGTAMIEYSFNVGLMEVGGTQTTV